MRWFVVLLQPGFLRGDVYGTQYVQGSERVRISFLRAGTPGQPAQNSPPFAHPRRSQTHAASISFACLRVVAVISRPPSIRATSSMRLDLSSGVTVLTVPPA